MRKDFRQREPAGTWLEWSERGRGRSYQALSTVVWELGFRSASGGKPLEHLSKLWFVFRKLPLAALWSADCTGGGRRRREGGWEATGV